MANEPMAHTYNDDFGLNVIINMGEDVSSASDVTFEVEKPDGTIDTWTGIEVYNNNSFLYLVEDGDLDDSGVYRIQVRLTLGDFTGSASIVTLRVSPKLEA